MNPSSLAASQFAKREKYRMLSKEARVVAPEEFGFHCNGDCWNSLGAHEGLINFLESEKNVSFRDWFVNAGWTQNEPSRMTLPELGELHATQDYLNMNSVRLYASHSHRGRKDSFERFPSIFVWNERMFMFQGTHRLSAAYVRGDDHFTGWIVNLDS